MIVQMPISVFFFIWSVALRVVMRVIEKENGSNAILSILQLGGAIFTTVLP